MSIYSLNFSLFMLYLMSKGKSHSTLTKTYYNIDLTISISSLIISSSESTIDNFTNLSC